MERTGSNQGIPDNMEVLFLGLLKRGPAWTPEVTPEIEALQAAHLAHIDRMVQAGKLVAVGPIDDGSELRGIYIFRTASVEESNALTKTDPAVAAGRLTFELHPWMVRKGTFREER